MKNPEFLESVSEPKSKSESKAKLASSSDLESDTESKTEEVENWWEQIPVESTVIFWIDGNPDRRRKVVKDLMAACDVKECKAFSPWEADQAVVWIMQRTEGQGRRIDPAAAELLVATTGTTLRPLIQELEKLSLYAGPRESITVAHVELLAQPGAVAAFALSNALRERRLAESLIVLERMFQEREESVRLLGQLAAQFRMIAQVKALSDSRMDISRMASQLSSNPAYVRRCLTSARLFQFSELKEILYKMHDIDLLLKTTMISPRTLLEELMTFICRGFSVSSVSETVYA